MKLSHECDITIAVFVTIDVSTIMLPLTNQTSDYMWLFFESTRTLIRFKSEPAAF